MATLEKQINSKGNPFPDVIANQTGFIDIEALMGVTWHKALISEWSKVAKTPQGYLSTCAAYVPYHNDATDSDVMFVIVLKDAWKDFPDFTEEQLIKAHKQQAFHKYGYEPSHVAVAYVDPFKDMVDKQS